jgi:hypothetical protein
MEISSLLVVTPGRAHRHEPAVALLFDEFLQFPGEARQMFNGMSRTPPWTGVINRLAWITRRTARTLTIRIATRMPHSS